jgi:hypothetical protein
MSGLTGDPDALFADAMFCPITLDLMHDPVIDPEGNSYERAAIQEHLRRHPSSPITRTPLTPHQLAPNRALQDAIESRKEEIAASAGKDRIDPASLELGEIVGAGAFGEVRKGVWRGILVAVKTARKEGEDLAPEAELLAQLGKHPRVVRFYGKSTTPDGRWCIVTEFARLGGLDGLLEEHYDDDGDKSLLTGSVVATE